MCVWCVLYSLQQLLGRYLQSILVCKCGNIIMMIAALYHSQYSLNIDDHFANNCVLYSLFGSTVYCFLILVTFLSLKLEST